MYRNVPQYTVVYRYAWQCVVMYRNASQCTVMYRNASQCTVMHRNVHIFCFPAESKQTIAPIVSHNMGGMGGQARKSAAAFVLRHLSRCLRVVALKGST